MFAARRRLSVPARSKGCILLCSFTEKLEEIRSLLVVRKLIRISVPMFWPGSCPTNFHKTTENSNCGFASHKHKNDYLWCLHDMLLMGHSIWEMSKCNVLVTTPGFCNQLEEVCFENSAGDRIFGSKNQLSQPRNISHKGDNTESKNNMSTFTDRTKNIDFRINKSD